MVYILKIFLCYGMDHDGQGTAFNGNMASVEWSSLNDVTRRYSFRYDGLSRLSGAIYTEENNENNDRYSTSYSYDKQGNIESLSRNGLQDDGTYGKVDDLFYEYDGNRLVKVSNAVESPCYKGAMHFSDGADEETEYLYDDDGNMVCDKNRGISEITYNIILKPEHIRFNTGRYMSLAYSATGEKLQANYMLELPRLHEPGIRTLSSGQSGFGNSLGGLDGPVGPGIRDSLIDKDRPQLGDNQYALIYGAHRTDYCGNVIYEDLRPIPDRILFDGGYVTFSNKQPVYHFYLTDHQGNVRVVASADGTLEETNHYYPFGALFGESAGSNRQRYKYNGKELERLLALDWYDYGARWYDPVLARWHAVDPLAEKYPDISPYVYCNNNAVNAVDPDGRDVWIIYKDKQGNDQIFQFTGFRGKKTITIPNNQFIKDFIMAYNYNIKNGGGDNLKEAVTNSKYKIYVYNSLDDDEPITEFDHAVYPIVKWESRRGIKTTNGGFQSAATRLEHEFDHAIDWSKDKVAHVRNVKSKDLQYENKEERRVITGSEAKTAKANGEEVRKDHKGEVYNTISPISTRPILK